jgi:hypothetical protein
VLYCKKNQHKPQDRKLPVQETISNTNLQICHQSMAHSKSSYKRFPPWVCEGAITATFSALVDRGTECVAKGAEDIATG